MMKLLVAGGALLGAVTVSLAACSGPGGTASVATLTPTPSPTPITSGAPTATPSPPPVNALWAIDGATVVEFTTAQIASGTINPIHQFSIADPNLTLSFGMAFDRLGNLWIVRGMFNTPPSTKNLPRRTPCFWASPLGAPGAAPPPPPRKTPPHTG